MRLCLVSAILALFITIQFQSDQYGLLILLSFGVLICARNNPVLNRIVATIGILISAYYSQYWLDDRLSSRLGADLSGMTVTGIGEVTGCRDVNSTDSKSTGSKNTGSKSSETSSAVEKLEINIDSLIAPESNVPAMKRLALNYYRTENAESGVTPAKIICGSIIQFTAKLRAPYGFINPWGFDYEAWQLSRGIDASGYLLEHKVLATATGWRSQLRGLREQWIQRAASLKGVSGQLIPALLFGESGYLPKEQWLDFQLTGTIHLLIVSGLHVGFLVFIITALWYVLIRLEIMLFFPRSSVLFKLTPFVLLLACAVYAYMAGMGLAIQRAGFMLALGICVVYMRNHWSLFDTWLWVMLLVLLVNPLSILFIGFWFSFAAVGALLMSYDGQIRYRSKSDGSALKFSKIEERIKLLYQPQWIVFIALMPLLWLFQQPQSALSFFTNIIAIPLLGFVVMPLSLLAFIWPESLAVDMLNGVLTHAMSFLHQLSLYPSWLVYKPAGIWLILLFPLIVSALWFAGAPYKRLSLMLLVCVFLMPVTVKDQKLIVFDVGQGLAVYGSDYQSNDDSTQYTWLYDTGAKFRSGFSLGDAVVAKNILGFNGQALDLLFISHSDNDHAGGEAGLRRKITANLTYAGQPNKPHHTHCHGNEGWMPFANTKGSEGQILEKEHGSRWRIFNYNLPNASDNNQSCIVQVEMAGKRILLPGDIDKKAEKRLIATYGKELKSDILIVGHHGSKSSSTEEWIVQVAPQIAVVSSGFKNRYHHPHASVLTRFSHHSIPIYNTAEAGAIEINLSESMSVTQWRMKNTPNWRQM